MRTVSSVISTVVVVAMALFPIACSSADDSGNALNVRGSGGGSGAKDPANPDAATTTDPADPTGGTGGTGDPGAGSGGDGGSPSTGDGGATTNPSAGDGGTSLPALTECTGAPSLDRLQKWLASGEGTTVPATGDILVKDGAKYVAKVTFVNAEWHVVPVWIANKFDNGQADLTRAASFTLTYSATSDFYVQIRPASYWSGGDKYLAKIPSTGGQIQTKAIPFNAQTFTTLPELGTPTYSFADSLKDVRGLVFVGKTPNVIAISGLRIDGYAPTCL